MLSQEYIDYPKIEKYVRELGFDRKNVLTEKNGNTHSSSVSYKRDVGMGGSCYKEGEGWGRGGVGVKSPVSSSMDYGKGFEMVGFRSDQEIMKRLEGREKESERGRERERER